MFVLTKIAGLLLTPSFLLLLALCCGVGAARLGATRWARRLIGGAALGLLIAGASPLGHLLILPLEERFPARNNLPGDQDVVGLIVLGGGISTSIGAARGQFSSNEAGERVQIGLALARAYPQLKVVFSGGNSALLIRGRAEADFIATAFVEAGLPVDRLRTEDRSRNTYENARNTAELISGDGPGSWLLVTSAYHMPRAMGAFRSAGVDVVAWPVDYRTRGWEDATSFGIDLPGGLARVDFVTREWLGLVFYWLAGRTDRVLPGAD